MISKLFYDLVIVQIQRIVRYHKKCPKFFITKCLKGLSFCVEKISEILGRSGIT